MFGQMPRSMLLIVCSLIVVVALASWSIMANKALGDAHLARVTFGRCVRQIREQQGLSQEKLAELANVHRTYISSVERGQRNIGLDNIISLARALGVSPAQFFEHG
jgi:ribosome-binding protein aMBF1 (putative translation factor)